MMTQHTDRDLRAAGRISAINIAYRAIPIAFCSACGRTNVRMTRIIGRSDDMLIIRGINVFPSQVESVILEMPEFEPVYMLVVDRINSLDTLQVQVEVRKDYFSDELGAMLQLRKRLADKLKSVLSISADIRLMEPNSIPRSEGKSMRVIDKRQLK